MSRIRQHDVVVGIGFLFLFWQGICFAENAQELKARYFGNIETVKVVESSYRDLPHYLILAVSHLRQDDPNAMLIAKKRNALITRAALFHYIQKKQNLEISRVSLEVQGMLTAGDWSHVSTFYQLSYVPVASVKVLPKHTHSKDAVSIASVNSEIYKEIDRLEIYAKENPSSLETQQSLYELYLSSGNLEGANDAMDRIIELKF